jgi:hypothetical protein
MKYQTLLSPGDQVGIVRAPAPADPRCWNRPTLSGLPRYDPGSPGTFQVDLRSRDVSRFDCRDRLDDLLKADFDSGTRWPSILPPGFDPETVLETAKNPGLRVRELHRRGITGQGIGIAVIDAPLLVDHWEYKDRLKLYEEIHVPKGCRAQMHGTGVASIAAGATMGVAPGADLYCIGEQEGTSQGDQFQYDFTWLAKSIDRILDVNQRLPRRHRVRVISISVGWVPDQNGYPEISQSLQRARRAGVFVISTVLERTHGLAFHGLGRDPHQDPDSPTSYGLGSWWARGYLDGSRRFPTGTRLLVPMDSRTTASPCAANHFAYYADGGWSWVVPYLAGLYALACQVAPDVTPQMFWATAMRTADTLKIDHRGEHLDLGNIVNPVSLLEALETSAPTM